jgi:hypothetical protein
MVDAPVRRIRCWRKWATNGFRLGNVHTDDYQRIFGDRASACSLASREYSTAFEALSLRP